jgi:hypothetical protein
MHTHLRGRCRLRAQRVVEGDQRCHRGADDARDVGVVKPRDAQREPEHCHVQLLVAQATRRGGHARAAPLLLLAAATDARVPRAVDACVCRGAGRRGTSPRHSAAAAEVDVASGRRHRRQARGAAGATILRCVARGRRPARPARFVV